MAPLTRRCTLAAALTLAMVFATAASALGAERLRIDWSGGDAAFTSPYIYVRGVDGEGRSQYACTRRSAGEPNSQDRCSLNVPPQTHWDDSNYDSIAFFDDDPAQGRCFRFSVSDSEQGAPPIDVTATLTDIDGTRRTVRVRADNNGTQTPTEVDLGASPMASGEGRRLDQGCAGAGKTEEPPGNRPPEARCDAYFVPRGRTLRVPAASGLLSNDTDPDGDALTATPVSLSFAAKKWSLDGETGAFRYVASAKRATRDVVTYRARDAHGALSAPQTAYIFIGTRPAASPCPEQRRVASPPTRLNPKPLRKPKPGSKPKPMAVPTSPPRPPRLLAGYGDLEGSAYSCNDERTKCYQIYSNATAIELYAKTAWASPDIEKALIDNCLKSSILKAAFNCNARGIVKDLALESLGSSSLKKSLGEAIRDPLNGCWGTYRYLNFRGKLKVRADPIDSFAPVNKVWNFGSHPTGLMCRGGKLVRVISQPFSFPGRLNF